MIGFTEWTMLPDSASEEGKPKPVCPKAIAGHRWVLDIEEGQIGLKLAEGEECPTYGYLCPPGEERPVCELDVEQYFEPEQLAGGPFPVAIAIETEQTMDETYCWLNIKLAL